MHIAIISDTHRRLPTAVHRLFEGCDLIMHAGDIGSPRILQELETIAPVLAVLGNNDLPRDYDGIPYQRLEIISGLSIFMAHDQLAVMRYLKTCTGIDGAPSLPDICIHGHSHQPRNEIVAGVRIINPGSIHQPRSGSSRSVAVLALSIGRVDEIRFYPLNL